MSGVGISIPMRSLAMAMDESDKNGVIEVSGRLKMRKRGWRCK